jgi:translation initiation factor 3 subunit K
VAGDALTAYVKQLAWAVDSATGNIVVPPNPDNQIEATVVQEQIKLPRKLHRYFCFTLWF